MEICHRYLSNAHTSVLPYIPGLFHLFFCRQKMRECSKTLCFSLRNSEFTVFYYYYLLICWYFFLYINQTYGYEVFHHLIRLYVHFGAFKLIRARNEMKFFASHPQYESFDPKMLILWNVKSMLQTRYEFEQKKNGNCARMNFMELEP